MDIIQGTWLEYGEWWQAWTMLALVILGLFAYHRSERYLERAVAKRTERERIKAQWKSVEDVISEAINRHIKAGQLDMESSHRVYQRLYDAGFKGIGQSMAYGRTWHRNWPTFNALAVKDRITKRLQKMGVNVKEKLNTMKRSSKPTTTRLDKLKAKYVKSEYVKN